MFCFFFFNRRLFQSMAAVKRPFQLTQNDTSVLLEAAFYEIFYRTHKLPTADQITS